MNNCCMKTGLLSGSAVHDSHSEPAANTSSEGQFWQVMSSLVVPDAQMSIHALLSSDNVDCHEEVSIGNMADSVMHALRNDENSLTHE